MNQNSYLVSVNSLTARFMMVSGMKASLKDWASKFGQTDENMKATGIKVNLSVKVLKLTPMEP